MGMKLLTWSGMGMKLVTWSGMGMKLVTWSGMGMKLVTWSGMGMKLVTWSGMGMCHNAHAVTVGTLLQISGWNASGIGLVLCKMILPLSQLCVCV